MLRYLVGVMFMLLAMRFVVGLARMLTSGGTRPKVDPGERPESKRSPRYDSSNAIDVPFTEIPPESPR